MRCVFDQKFWIDMVEKNKLERELTFRELEAEGGEGIEGGGADSEEGGGAPHGDHRRSDAVPSAEKVEPKGVIDEKARLATQTTRELRKALADASASTELRHVSGFHPAAMLHL